MAMSVDDVLADYCAFCGSKSIMVQGMGGARVQGKVATCRENEGPM